MAVERCPHCGRRAGSEVHAAICPLGHTDPADPEGFPGSDEGSHYMSQTRIESKEDFADAYGDFDPSEKPKLFRERLDGTLARAMSEGDETLDELRTRLVERLDATSWARNEFSDERVAKQVIVVRADLKMRKGKIAAQAAHASMKVLLDRSLLSNAHEAPQLGPSGEDDFDRVLREVRNAEPPLLTVTLTPAMQDWISGRFTKVCCRVESEEALLRICDAALKARLSCSLIQDAGLTEFKGQPTLTCCAIGPAYPEDIDPVTGHLKLL